MKQDCHRQDKDEGLRLDSCRGDSNASTPSVRGWRVPGSVPPPGLWRDLGSKQEGDRLPLTYKGGSAREDRQTDSDSAP